MSKDLSKNRHIFALKGKNVDELRALASKYISDYSINGAESREILEQQLSSEAYRNKKLMLDLKKTSIKIKASFFFMAISSLKEFKNDNKLMYRLRQIAIELNTIITRKGGKYPTYKDFTINSCEVDKNNSVFIEFSWAKINWYWNWNPLNRLNKYEFNYGFCLLNLKEKKAVISCHTIDERDYLNKIVESVFEIKLSPIKLTKPLLNQIGDFTKVKKAGYFLANSDQDFPSNVEYSDEYLSKKKNATLLEASNTVIRTHSYYHIPINDITEQGVGVTSSTGKLWIPREIPIASIREYCIALLAKISDQMKEMENQGHLDQLLETLDIYNQPQIRLIKNKKIKNQICLLLVELVNMLKNEEKDRVLKVNAEFFTIMVPKYFNYPRLILNDPKDNTIAFWTDESKITQFISVKKNKDSYSLNGYPSGEVIDINKLYHPISLNTIEITDINDALELIPTKQLVDTLVDTINNISEQINLERIERLPFYIFNSVIYLKDDRVYPSATQEIRKDEIAPEEINSFRDIFKHKLNVKEIKKYEDTVLKLKEKCNFMSDDKCITCNRDRDYICLRSLVGNFLREVRILGHKSIELSDLQGMISVDKKFVRTYGFSKIRSASAGLTLRNEGATLLSQFVAHFDKIDFQIASIISHSTINEDLIERLRYLCSLKNKSLLIIDKQILARMYCDLDDKLRLEGQDINIMLKNSYQKKKNIRKLKNAKTIS